MISPPISSDQDWATNKGRARARSLTAHSLGPHDSPRGVRHARLPCARHLATEDDQNGREQVNMTVRMRRSARLAT